MADQLARDFPAVPDLYLNWEYRSPRILCEIERFNADILCFEEVDHFSDFYEPELSKIGYTGIWHQKPEWHNDGEAIFFKTSRFELKIANNFQFLGHNQSALYVILLDKVTCEEIEVYVTHLKANKQYESVRVSQIEALLNHLSAKDLDKKLIVCGDFNSLPGGPAYAKMSENNIGLRSVFKDVLGPGEPLTTIKHRSTLEKKTEDYI